MKYEINVNEKRTLNHTIILEVEDGVDLDSILDAAQKESSLSDVRYSLREQGCDIITVSEDEDGDSEIEIDDMFEV